MTIYVDKLFLMTPKTRQAQRHGNQWCHLFTDSDDLTELHEMAQKIGLKQSYFQNHKRKAYQFPHYDLTPTKRQLAINNGAVEIEIRDFVKTMIEQQKRNEPNN